MIKAKKLRRGDKVAAISLSWGGAGAFAHRYEVGKQQLQERFGLQVVETRHALREPEWLDKNPEARAEDLMEAFADPEIKAIISTIGGDDSIRLLPYIDLEVIGSHPKIFMGYSDTTISHFACLKAGLVSFYGPAIMVSFAENGGILPYVASSVEKTLFSAEPVGVIEPNMEGWTVERLDWAVPENQSRKRKLTPASGWRFLQGQGIVQGRLIGGCIEVIPWLKETALWPDKDVWEGAILFLETSEEAPPPIYVARELRSYAAMGILPKLSGILFARPGGDVPPNKFIDYDQAILKVVAEEEGLTELPIITHMDFGHTEPIFILPLGVQAQIDCERKELAIIENAVVE
ncbi:MAG: S66 family peptidase [Ardenticatenaceae bacterium]